RLRKGVFQRFEDSLLAVEQVHGVLGEIAHLDAGADRYAAVVWFGRAGNQPEQSRFAGAVDPHHAPTLPAADGKIEAVINAAFAVALANALQAGDVLARARRRQKL